MQLSSRSKLHSKTLKTNSKNTKNSKKITLLQKSLAVTEAIGELMSHAVVNVYVTEKAELDKAE